MSLREKIAGEGYARLRNRPFLEASMAASALIAMADEHVNAAERLSVESVMENIRRLNVFEPRTAIRLHCQFVAAIRANASTGEALALRAISRFKGDLKAGEMLVSIAHYTALADNELVPEELVAIRRVYRELGMDPAHHEPAIEYDEPNGPRSRTYRLRTA